MRRLPLALAAAGLALAPSVMAAPSASAAPDCSTKVVDGAGKLDVPKVEQAVTDAEHKTGADVYVRTFKDTPNKDSATWWRNTVSECSSWRGTDGKPKPNILVVEFGLDRTSALAYGRNFDSLSSSIDRLRAGMNDHLRKEEYTPAMTDTLSKVSQAITSPPPKESKQSSGPNISGDAVATFFAWLAGIAGVIAGVFGAVKAFLWARSRSAQKRADARRLAQAKDALEQARAKAAEAVIKVDFTAAKMRVAEAAHKVEGGFTDDNLDRADALADEASADYAELSNAAEPTTTEEFVNRADDFDSVTSRIEKATALANGVAEGAEVKASQCTPEAKAEWARKTERKYTSLRASLCDVNADLSAEVSALDKGFAVAKAKVEKHNPPSMEELHTFMVEVDRLHTKYSPLIGNVQSLRDALSRVAVEATDLPRQHREATSYLGLNTRLATQLNRTYAGMEAVKAHANRALELNKPSLNALGKELDDVKREFAHAHAPLHSDIAKAKQKREKERWRKAEDERRKREEEQRRRDEERRQRDEEDRARRRRSSSSSYSGSDFGTGYIAGSSFGSSFGGGGFDSGSSGGGGFDGGSFGGF